MPVKKLELRIKNKELSKKQTVILSETTPKMGETRDLKIKKASGDLSLIARDDKNKTTRKTGGFAVPVYSLAGKAAGSMSLPKEIFGGRVNKKLLAQALRVYMSNQKSHPGSTKTRGQVRGSTAKIYRQKGTGRARHGAKKAPIFVGGGIVFGPTPRIVRLDLPKKMKKAALLSALAAKMADKEICGISGLEKASGKTKEISEVIRKVAESMGNKGNTLIVTGEKQDNVVRGVRNITGADVLPANQINAYEVLRHQILLLTKEAVTLLQNDKKEVIK